jgi:CO/xanthine dehydrogenase Mo-binding subunit
MNRIADALGMDAVEIRMRNILHEGDLLSVGTPLPKGVSIPQVVEHCAQESGWHNTEEGWKRPERFHLSSREKSHSGKAYFKKGMGFACAFKNVGFSFGAPERSLSTVELHGGSDIEKVIVHHAGADVGQGAHTVFEQIAADAIGVSLEKVELIVSDTAQTDDSGSTSASRMTFMAGNAIKGACDIALERWSDEERPAIGTYEYRPPATTPFDQKTGYSNPNFSYGYVAQAVEVEVDLETGRIKIMDVVSADDVGKALNPQQIEGQIEGAVVQAAGYTILENFQQLNGYVQTEYLSTYLIPTVLDVPDRVRSLILEYPDPIGPWGARGMGEMPFLPLAPAIIAAVHDATGVWFFDFPLTPERVLRGLGRI